MFNFTATFPSIKCCKLGQNCALFFASKTFSLLNNNKCASNATLVCNVKAQLMGFSAEYNSLSKA